MSATQISHDSHTDEIQLAAIAATWQVIRAGESPALAVLASTPPPRPDTPRAARPRPAWWQRWTKAA